MPLDVAKVAAALPAFSGVVRIGGGGQAEVFRGTDPSGRPTALKVVNTHMWGKDRLERELLALTGVTSPHLPALLDQALTDIEIDGVAHSVLVEEFVEGEPLDRLIGPQWEEAEALLLMHDLTLALDAVSPKNLVHRDIKPPNVIRRSHDGRYVLLDLGVARHQTMTTLTSPGGHPGTPHYRSPEQLRARDDRKLDVRSDLFNVGLVGFEALTGEHAFVGRREPEHIYEHRATRGRSRKLHTYRGDLAQETKNLVSRLLMPFPNTRFRNALQTLETIHAAMDADGGRRCSCS